MTGAEVEDDIPLGERKTVTDFCYLLDKSKQLFNGLRSVLLPLLSSAMQVQHVIKKISSEILFDRLKKKKQHMAVYVSGGGGVPKRKKTPDWQR